MIHKFKLESKVKPSFNVKAVAGMFDVTLERKSVLEFEVDVPELDGDWQIGVIVGPSGSGKSSVAKQVFGKSIHTRFRWPKDAAMIDGMPGEVKIASAALTSVGFSSPPAWIRPFHVLSNGEQFRAEMARLLLSEKDPIVVDEFTSVVDRTVAQIGSAAIAKAIRRTQKRFVTVSCHYDILRWLEPDWVLDMGITGEGNSVGELSRRRLRRPQIKLELFRAESHAWRLFKTHHYLAASMSGVAYVATIEGRPVAFCSILPQYGKKRTWRLSRTVVLPDFQGVGIGTAISNLVAQMYVDEGNRVYAVTGHPGAIHSRTRSDLWETRKVYKHGRSPTGITTRDVRHDTRAARIRVSFEYVGAK